MKKGFIFTMDAMIALSIVIIIILTSAFVKFETILPEKTYEKLNYIAEDTMNMLAYLQVYEIQDKPTIKSLINDGVLDERDLNKTVLDLIASFWYKNNRTIAENISRDVLGGLYDVCLNLTVDGQTMYSSCNNKANDTAVSTRIESGYEPGKPAYGYVARAFLASIRGKKDSSYVYFGGYVGDGNITTNITLPPFDNILEAYMEMDAGSNFTLYINGNYSGDYNNGTAGGGFMRADKWVICNLTDQPYYCSNFTGGNNTLNFNFTGNGSFIGGGYFRVTYNTTQMAPEEEVGKDTYWFPGISGFFNLYDSFYVPGTLSSMTSYLHYFNNLTFEGKNATVYLAIGNNKIFSSNDTGEIIKPLSYNDIWQKFGSQQNLIGNVSNRTVPLRFGVEGFEAQGGGVGTADAVLITDVSGSMNDNTVNCYPNVSWQISTVRQQGNYGAQNQDINDTQTVCMYRNVTLSASGRIYFWWRVNSQANRDYLYFCYDLSSCNITSYTNRISGSTGWQQINRLVTSGNHEIEWCYSKDDSGSSGADTGYVDYIKINNSAGGIMFLDDFEDGILDGWSFSSSGQCIKLDVAKDVDKTFVDTVLSTPGDRVGLVAYSSAPGIWWWNGLSNDSTALKGNISQYQPEDCTCISCGIKNATDTLLAQSDSSRFRGMLVMSDGLANTIIPGTNRCGRPTSVQCPNQEGYRSVSGSEATLRACDARNLNITTFGVAFGNDADKEQMKRIACWNCTACPNVCQSGVPPNSPCWIQNVTLPNGSIAQCLAVRYAESNDVDELKKIYGAFGELFVKWGYTTQKATITGNVIFNNVLYPDSYIEFRYSPVVIPYQYGEISLTREASRLKDLTGDTISTPYKEGWFNISDQVKVVDAKITSYSSDYWTDMLWINSSTTGVWEEVYNLTYFGNDYTILGDPFIIHIPIDKISSGKNSVRIETGISPLSKTGGSPDDRVIYTIRVKGSVGYDKTFPSSDLAVADANQRLMDLVSDYVNVMTDDVQNQTKSITGVQSLWGPSSLKVVTWENKTT
jgi:hypothetical protein